MKLHKKQKQNKLSQWYHKPREGSLFRFSEWILTSDKSFSIILTMGSIVAVILFLGLFIISLIYWGLIAGLIFGTVFFLSLRQLYKMYRLRKQVGLKMNMAGFMYNDEVMEEKEQNGNNRQ